MITVTRRDGTSFQAYLAESSGGKGPGIVLLHEIFGVNRTMRRTADRLAAKGYRVLCPDLFARQEPGVELDEHREADCARGMELYTNLDESAAVDDVRDTIAHMREEGGCAVGVVGFCLGGKLAYLSATRGDPDCAVGYYGVGIESALKAAGDLSRPLMLHMPENDAFCPPDAQRRIREALNTKCVIHAYAQCNHAFARIGGAHYDAAAAELADLRTLDFLGDHLDRPMLRKSSPRHDLAAIWEEHIKYEFETRDHVDTLKTMVEDAYVNHIPTLTGGVGKAELSEFYSKRFIPQMPPDTNMTPVSRTVGEDRVVDEMIFKFTHTMEMDWMLPGIKPTGRRVEIPLVAIVHIRGDKLAHEHIYWDQASVLVQLGLLDATTLPVCGVETARKVLDNSIPSNALIERADRWKR